MNTVAIIPSLNPDDKLIGVVDGLLAVGFTRILLVNDGSDPACLAPFEQAASRPGVTVLTHEVNRGKGRAMKTAFTWCLKNASDSAGVVTVDGDGQHLPQDVLALAKAMEADPGKLWLGVRDFTLPNVPTRSRLGNTMTRGILRIACGVKVSDTQTGLRAISTALLPLMCQVEGERYEYETQQLLDMRRQEIPFGEVTIETVYIDENQTSHYRPLRDSLRILKMIAKYIFSSLAATLLEFLIFSAANLLLADTMPDASRLLVVTYGARIISATFNFLCNRKIVFQSDRSLVSSGFRYAALAIAVAACSYGLILLFSTLLHASEAAEILIKIPVDITLFFVTYTVQLNWVFKKPSSKS